MAITFVGAGTILEHGAGGTTAAVPYPASGIVAGDLGFLIYGANSATVLNFTADGWITARSQSSTGDTLVPDLIMAYKFLTGSENGTAPNITVPTPASSGQILVFRGVDPTTPLDVTVSYLDRTSTGTTTFIIPSLTTTVAGTALIYGAIQNSATGAAGATPSSPGAFTKDGDRVAGRNFTDGHLIWSGSGATGTVTVTLNTTTRGVAMLAALRPAADAGNPSSRRVNRASSPRRVVNRSDLRSVASTDIPFRQAAPIRTYRRTARRIAPRMAGNFVAPPPAAPPANPALVTQRQRERVRLAKYSKSRLEFTPMTQTAPTPPAFVPANQGRDRVLRGWLARRAKRIQVFASPDGPQQTARRQRLAWRRKASRVEVVPTQVVVTAPSLIPSASQRRALRGWLARRGKRVEVVPAQVVVVNPDYIPTATQRRALRGLLARRGRRPEVVITQAAPIAPAYVPQASQRRTHRGIATRRRTRPVAASAQERPPQTPRVRVRAAQRRGRRAPEVVPAQTPGILRYTPQATTRRVARWGRRRTRNAFQFVFEGLAQLFGTAEDYPRDNPSAGNYPNAGPTASPANLGGPTAELYDRDGPSAERS